MVWQLISQASRAWRRRTQRPAAQPTRAGLAGERRLGSSSERTGPQRAWTFKRQPLGRRQLGQPWLERPQLERLESRQLLAAFTPGNLLVTSSPSNQPSMLYEFTPTGTMVQSTAIPHPSTVISERARDVVLDSNGNAAVFNGTFDPRLTTYDPVAGTLSNSVVPFWSTGNNFTFGGLAALGDFVYGTDMRVRSEPVGGRGIVRFNSDNVQSGWTRGFDARIGDSQTNTSESIPHVTVLGTGDGSLDYYTITVPAANSRGIFDIDDGDTGGPGSFHSSLRLYNANGVLLANSAVFNSPLLGQTGSVSNRDAYLEYTFPAAGQYLVEVGGCCIPEGVPPGATYSLQMSVAGHSTFIPGGDATVTEVEPNNTRFTAQNADSADRFSADGGDVMDIAVGLDGLVYALIYTGSSSGGGNTVKVFDPADFRLLRTVTLPADHRAIAVDSAGHIYATQPGVSHYDSNGILLAARDNPVGGFLGDIDIKADGCVPGQASYPCLAIASNNGNIILTTTLLDEVEFFSARSSDSQTFVAFVEPPLRLPRAVADYYRVREDSSSNSLAVMVNDLVDSRGLLNITETSTPSAGGMLRIVGGRSLQYSPAANFAGLETFTYTIVDGLGSQSTATVSVEVSNINENPATGPDAYTVPEDSSGHRFDVLANDTGLPDVGEILTLVAVGPASAGGSVQLDGQVVFYSPAPNFEGVETFPYTVIDGNGGSTTATVTVTVENSNDPPTVRDDSFAINPNTLNNPLEVLANDSIEPDRDETLQILSLTAPAHGTAIIDNGIRIAYTPEPGYLGPDSLTYTVLDSNGAQATGTVSLTVTVVNNPPIATPDSYSINRNSTANRLRVLANDSTLPDVNEVLTITTVSAPNRGGTIVAAENNTVLRYTPAPQFAGVETFSYTVSDGRGAFATALVTINVGNFNSLPIPADDAYFIPQNSTANTLEVLANDFDPDGTNVLTVSAVGVASNGGILQISPDRLSILYTPPQPFLGTETFTYTVDDGRGGLETAQVTVTVIGWQNPENRLDVSRNGSVEALDALLVINELNAMSVIGPNGQLPTAPVDPPFFYDVTGDGFLTALDVLQIINALNAGAGEASESQPETNALASSAPIASNLADDALQAWGDTFAVVLGDGPSGVSNRFANANLNANALVAANANAEANEIASGPWSRDLGTAAHSVLTPSLADACLLAQLDTGHSTSFPPTDDSNSLANLSDANLSDASLSDVGLSDDTLDAIASDLFAAR